MLEDYIKILQTNPSASELIESIQPWKDTWFTTGPYLVAGRCPTQENLDGSFVSAVHGCSLPLLLKPVSQAEDGTQQF